MPATRFEMTVCLAGDTVDVLEGSGGRRATNRVAGPGHWRPAKRTQRGRGLGGQIGLGGDTGPRHGEPVSAQATAHALVFMVITGGRHAGVGCRWRRVVCVVVVDFARGRAMRFASGRVLVAHQLHEGGEQEQKREDEATSPMKPHRIAF